MFKKRRLYLFLLFLSFSLSSFSFFPSKEETTPPQQIETPEPKPKKQPPPVENKVLESPVDEMTTNYESTFFKMILTLVGLILLIFITFWTIRRLSQGRFRQMNAGRSIKIVERRPLSPKTILYLIEVGNKKVMIAESQLEVKTITDVENTIT